MPTIDKKWAIDAAERVGMTAAEAGIAFAIVELGSIQAWWVAPITMALAALKTLIAKKIGNADSASVVPTI